MKYKHLTLDDRVKIENLLSKGKSYQKIAKSIGKTKSTISYEVNRKSCGGNYTFKLKLFDTKYRILSGCHSKRSLKCHFSLWVLQDEAQGSMCHYLGYLVMIRHLSLKYQKAAPLEKEFVVRASLKRLNKKRIYTVGSIESKESGLHVSSRASWYILSEKIVHRMFSQQENKRDDDFTVKMVYDRLEVYRKKAKQSKVLAKLLV